MWTFADNALLIYLGDLESQYYKTNETMIVCGFLVVLNLLLDLLLLCFHVSIIDELMDPKGMKFIWTGGLVCC